ncbi:MAG: hypothetical protein HYR98_03995 [Nitrospirae bacterium]|nr:hypothetical protein [Nitrospirota bacterium]
MIPYGPVQPSRHGSQPHPERNGTSHRSGTFFRRSLSLRTASAMLAAVLLAPPVVWGEYGDVILDSKKESMEKAGVGPVVFPHWFHRIRFKCKVCHEDIFAMQRGANDISMKEIVQGRSCGVCHNVIVSWEPLYCERCHADAGTKGPAPAAVPKR